MPRRRALSASELEYSLGARERSDALVKIVMENDDPFVPLVVERQADETQLSFKQVKVEDNGYIMPHSSSSRGRSRTRGIAFGIWLTRA